MRVHLLLVATAVAGLTAATPGTAQRADAEADVRLGPISNQYICTFDRSVSPGSVRNEAAKAAGPVLGEILHTYQRTIKGFAVRLPVQPGGRSGVAEMKKNNPRIAGCEQDQVMKAFAGPPSGGGTTVERPWGVKRVGGVGATSSRTAWVIDSGIDLDHPDLKVDVGRSRNYASGTDAEDKNGHGTHVAGTIAAKANGTGVVGVAPGTTLVAVRVLGASGSGSTSGVIAGVEYVAGAAASGDVANMSLGGGFSQALNDAVKCAADGPSSGVAGCDAPGGIWFTLAAGNEGDPASTHSPGSANGAHIYTVSATDSSDRLASFSNYGPGVDWAEPGVSIKSTYKGGGYATMSGTSMAAPHLAGILLNTTSVRDGGAISGDRDTQTDHVGCWTTCPAP